MTLCTFWVGVRYDSKQVWPQLAKCFGRIGKCRQMFLRSTASVNITNQAKNMRLFSFMYRCEVLGLSYPLTIQHIKYVLRGPGSMGHHKVEEEKTNEDLF